jgi:plastocyanin
MMEQWGGQEVTMHHIGLAAAAALSAAILAPAAAQVAAPAAETIQVRSFAFAPTPIRLAAGRPVTLNFVNASDSGHDFTARVFFAHAQISAGAAPNGKIDLKGHESRSITLVPAAGTYEAHCSHFMHDSMGMHTQIIVG